MGDYTTYSLLLSTTITSGTNEVAYCSNATDLANASFTVNWGKVFNNMYQSKNKKLRVRCDLQSKSNTALVWNDCLGTLRITLPTKDTIPSNNGTLILGPLVPKDLGITVANTPHKLTCDTTSTVGVSCSFPIGIQTVKVSLLNLSEAPLSTGLVDYQVILFFDVYENGEYKI